MVMFEKARKDRRDGNSSQIARGELISFQTILYKYINTGG